MTAGLKRKDLGLASSLVVLAEVAAIFQSTSSVKREISMLRDEVEITRKYNNEVFVKKEDFNRLVEAYTDKQEFEAIKKKRKKNG